MFKSAKMCLHLAYSLRMIHIQVSIHFGVYFGVYSRCSHKNPLVVRLKALNSPCISDNDDETDQSGSSIEVKSEENKLLEEKPKTIVCICMLILFEWLTTFKETKKESQIKIEDTPSTSSIPESKFKPEVLVDDKETNEQLLKKLNKEFSLDEKELRELDGPEEVSTIFLK